MPRKGDVNGDGVKNYEDIQMFTQKLLGNDTSLATAENYCGEYGDWSGNDDGSTDGRDIQPFVDALTGN